MANERIGDTSDVSEYDDFDRIMIATLAAANLGGVDPKDLKEIADQEGRDFRTAVGRLVSVWQRRIDPDGEVEATADGYEVDGRLAEIRKSVPRVLASMSPGESSKKLSQSFERARRSPNFKREGIDQVESQIHALAQNLIARAGIALGPVAKIVSRPRGLSRRIISQGTESIELVLSDPKTGKTKELNYEQSPPVPAEALSGGNGRYIPEQVVGGLIGKDGDHERLQSALEALGMGDSKEQIAFGGQKTGVNTLDRKTTQTLQLIGEQIRYGGKEEDNSLYRPTKDAYGTSPSDIPKEFLPDATTLVSSTEETREDIPRAKEEDQSDPSPIKVKMMPGWPENFFGERAVTGNLAIEDLRAIREHFEINPHDCSEEQRATLIDLMSVEDEKYQKLVGQLFDPAAEERALVEAQYVVKEPESPKKIELYAPRVGLKFELNEGGLLDEGQLDEIRERLGVDVNASPVELSRTLYKVAAELGIMKTEEVEGDRRPIHEDLLKQLLGRVEIKSNGKGGFVVEKITSHRRPEQVSSPSWAEKSTEVEVAGVGKLQLNEDGMAHEDDLALIKSLLLTSTLEGEVGDGKNGASKVKETKQVEDQDWRNVVAGLGWTIEQAVDNKEFIEQLTNRKAVLTQGPNGQKTISFLNSKEYAKFEEAKQEEKVIQEAWSLLQKTLYENDGSFEVSRSKFLDQIFEELDYNLLLPKKFRGGSRRENRQAVIKVFDAISSRRPGLNIEFLDSRIKKFGRGKVKVSHEGQPSNEQAKDEYRLGLIRRSLAGMIPDARHIWYLNKNPESGEPQDLTKDEIAEILLSKLKRQHKDGTEELIFGFRKFEKMGESDQKKAIIALLEEEVSLNPKLEIKSRKLSNRVRVVFERGVDGSKIRN